MQDIEDPLPGIGRKRISKLSLTPDEIMRHAIVESGRAPSGTKALAIILKAAQIRKRAQTPDGSQDGDRQSLKGLAKMI
jgi:hypothetical protein